MGPRIKTLIYVGRCRLPVLREVATARDRTIAKVTFWSD